MIKVKIVNTLYKINIPDQLVYGLIDGFVCNDPRTEDVLIDITQDKMLSIPETAVKEVSMPIHSLYTDRDFKYFIQTEDELITYMRYSRNLTYFQININDAINIDELEQQRTDQLSAVLLDDMIWKVVSMDVASKNGICLHCVALRYKGDAILFSAKARTGKTTHTNFWKEIFDGVEIINGDNGLCFPESPYSCVYGSPWAGTSDDCINIKAPIRAVVFLEQAAENSIAKLDSPEAFMRLSSRCFMPAWDRDLTIKALDTAESLVKKVDCYLLKCLPNHDAARILERELYG